MCLHICPSSRLSWSPVFWGCGFCPSGSGEFCGHRSAQLASVPTPSGFTWENGCGRWCQGGCRDGVAPSLHAGVLQLGFSPGLAPPSLPRKAHPGGEMLTCAAGATQPQGKHIRAGSVLSRSISFSAGMEGTAKLPVCPPCCMYTQACFKKISAFSNDRRDFYDINS